ncbi:protein of unknown function [Actinomadura madurae]|uniref:DUF1996 domain-containing protein n=1 Tax=Actinomadura madurae TaxID=1993 RepID=A0A1I5SAW5_9ACTN|nr:DUF1996 domain-containing protein [Actinomadura madurae]SFP67416.1 protein of unknown function [Actinomadura madurae]
MRKQHRQQGRRLAQHPRVTALASAVLASGLAVVVTGAPALAQAPRPPAEQSITCPPVAAELPPVSVAARAEVDRNLALLDAQIAQANRRLARSAGEGGPNFVRNAILGPLKDKRLATLNRIATAIGRSGSRPSGLGRLAACSLSDRPGGQNSGSPTPADFIDIRKVPVNVQAPRKTSAASRGSFVSRCGRNAQGQHNSDNVITSPGVSNGAHHVHDYVGNTSTSGQSTDATLAAAGTTCLNGDKSTHYWPVLRLRNGSDSDANAPGGGKDGNIGRILTPASVTLRFTGNPRSKVVAMPRFIRIITGDAKAFTNGGAKANAQWTCTGFENRRVADKYPLCPRGSRVERILQFQSCWDGANTDSANHRDHVAFTTRNGTCPAGTKAIPALEQRITYAVPRGVVYALDTFPEQLHKPITDHGDFINVMPDALMKRAVNCINTGRRCT